MPNFNTVSELVITIEVMERSFSLFQLHKKRKILNSEDFYYIIWKQLNTELRDFVTKSKTLSDYLNNQIYKSQIDGICSKFSDYFEI